jgi:nicotinamidase/pyrazinamidase
MNFREFLEARNALIVVDIQKDFMPGGSLAVANADQIIPFINNLASKIRGQGGIVVYTADMHPEAHSSFKQHGGIWPPHCVVNTFGSEFHPDLNVNGPIFAKGTEKDKDSYSGFGGQTEEGQTLEAYLRHYGVKNIIVVGVALDYCVKATAFDAKRHGFNTKVILAGTKAVSQDKVKEIVDEIRKSGIEVVEQ